MFVHFLCNSGFACFKLAEVARRAEINGGQSAFCCKRGRSVKIRQQELNPLNQRVFWFLVNEKQKHGKKTQKIDENRSVTPSQSNSVSKIFSAENAEKVTKISVVRFHTGQIVIPLNFNSHSYDECSQSGSVASAPTESPDAAGNRILTSHSGHAPAILPIKNC